MCWKNLKMSNFENTENGRHFWNIGDVCPIHIADICRASIIRHCLRTLHSFDCELNTTKSDHTHMRVGDRDVRRRRSAGHEVGLVRTRRRRLQIGVQSSSGAINVSSVPASFVGTILAVVLAHPCWDTGWWRMIVNWSYQDRHCAINGPRGRWHNWRIRCGLVAVTQVLRT